MQFDILLPGTNRAPYFCRFAHTLDATGYRKIVGVVDKLDFLSISVSDHLGMPHHEVPRLGAHWDEAVSVMSFVLGATERVRVDTCALVAPLHHPLRLAKAIATIDNLSGGRVSLTVGVGHAEQEFNVLRIPFNKRGAIADEVLEAMVTLWTEENPQYHGTYFDIDGLAIEPKPLQAPRPPIFVGGNSKPAVRRAARYDGWQPAWVNFDPSEIPALLDYARAQDAFAGKEDTFDVIWVAEPSDKDLPKGFAGASVRELRGYRDSLIDLYSATYPALGITRAIVQPPQSLSHVDEYLEFLRWFSAEVIANVEDDRPSRWSGVQGRV